MGNYALLQPGQHPPRAADFPVLDIMDLDEAAMAQLCRPEGGVLVLDLETQGTQVWDCTRLVVMFSVADASGSLAVHIGTSLEGQLRWRHLLRLWLEEYTPLLAHNVAFDAAWLSRDLTLTVWGIAPGVPVAAKFWDTGVVWHNWFGCTLAMAKHFASESFIGQQHGLKFLQKDLLGWPESNEKELDEWLCNNGWGEWANKKQPDGSKALVPKPNKAEMWRAPAAILGRYAALDAESTWLLWDKVLRPVWDTFGAYREMHQDWMHGEHGNQRHLVWQKLRGVAIDTGRAETLRAALEARLAELEDEFRAHLDVAAHVQAMEAEVVQEIANREPSRWKKLPGDGGGVPPQYTKSGAVSKSWLAWHEKQARARQLLADIQASEARDDGQAVGTAVEFQSSHWTGWHEKLQRAKAARHFNLRSSEQKRQLFYDRMGLEVLVWTEPDNPNSEPQPGTDEEAMKGWGEAGKVLMTYATVEKLRSTIESLQEKLDSEGRYHPELRVPGTQTGRLSGSGGFNWQNVAKRKEYLEIFRAPEGKVLMFADVCFAPWTEILTKAGWKTFEHVTQDDLVAAVNPISKKLQWEHPQRVIWKDYDGTLHTFGNRRGTLSVTDGHRMLWAGQQTVPRKMGLRKVTRAEDGVPKGTQDMLCVAHEESYSHYTAEEIWKVCALQADGSLYQGTKACYRIEVGKPRKITRLKELFGDSSRSTKARPGQNFDTQSWYISQFRSALLDGKSLDLSTLGSNQCDEFLAALHFWDGSTDKNAIVWGTTDKKSADEVSVYLARCGISLKWEEPSLLGSGKLFYRVRITRKSSIRLRPTYDYKREHFQGKVGCVTVSTGFVLVRSKGQTFVSGNCALEPTTLAQRSQDPTYMSIYGPDAKPNCIYLAVAANLGGELGAKIRATGFDPRNPTAEAVAKAKKEAKKERNIAKLLHLSAGYSAGPGKIRMGLSGQGIEVSLGEAKRLHSAYWGLFAQVKKYEKWLKAQWERNGGWWLNPIGRPVCADERKLKDLCNVDCQSGGHDIFLLFTKVLAEELSKRGIVYQPWNYDIHDCTALEIDERDVDEVREVVDKVVPDKVNALLGGVVRLKWEANFVKCWAEDKTESPSIDELGVKL
jgi:hypothetical protein